MVELLRLLQTVFAQCLAGYSKESNCFSTTQSVSFSLFSLIVSCFASLPSRLGYFLIKVAVSKVVSKCIFHSLASFHSIINSNIQHMTKMMNHKSLFFTSLICAATPFFLQNVHLKTCAIKVLPSFTSSKFIFAAKCF